MRHVLDTDHGRAVYRQRRETIEPLFGHTNTTEASRAFTDADGDKSAPNGG